METYQSHHISHSDNQYEAWERCNVMVISWITRSITTQIAQSTVYIDNAKELWEDLRERFSKGNHFSCFKSFKCSCNMMKTMSTYKDSERVMCFLKGLGEMYNDVKTKILLIESLQE